MTKKQFNSICSLYHQGASPQVCINLILDFCKKKNADPASWIVKFFQEKIILHLNGEIFDLMEDLKTTKKNLQIEEIRVAELLRRLPDDED